ncbi:MAG: substrate-binding domain-containing protein, partial [Amylibacter sp.]
AFEMATCVLEHGHRNVAMIAGISKDNDRAKNRIAGVKNAINGFGHGARLLRIVESPYLLAESANAFDEIMKGPDVPSVIICGNDVLAAGAITRARECGVSVPKQLSVTGFDDIGLALVVDPALTTVRVPQIEMGKAAARILLSKLTGDDTISSLEFKTEVVLRSSLARVSL